MGPCHTVQYVYLMFEAIYDFLGGSQPCKGKRASGSNIFAQLGGKLGGYVEQGFGLRGIEPGAIPKVYEHKFVWPGGVLELLGEWWVYFFQCGDVAFVIPVGDSGDWSHLAGQGDLGIYKQGGVKLWYLRYFFV